MKIESICGLAILILSVQVVAQEQRIRGDLTASKAVKEAFENPEVQQIIAGMKIKCVRHRRVGTHLISKTCMSVDEWAKKTAETSDIFRNNYRIGMCAPSSSAIGGEYMNSDVRGALIPTGCGDGINRGP